MAMPMKKWIVPIVVIAFAIPVFGQGLKLGPQAGFQKAVDAEEGKWMGGVALRAKLLPKIGVEGSINYRQEEYADGLLKVQSWPVMVTGMYYPLPILYGAVGFGWYNTTFNYDEDQIETDFGGVQIEDETTQEVGWHFGAGVEIPAGAGAVITGDIKYVFLDYEFEELPGGGSLSNSNFYVINIGLLFGL